MPSLSAIGAGGCCLALALATVSGQQPQAPVFRGGVEIFHLDVSVLDKNRQPVRGLKAGDFTVLEDGKPQQVVALSSVDIPDPIKPPVPWMRDVAPDVATNQLKDGRLLVIVMDDATIPAHPLAQQNARLIGREVVNRLGPNDLAAVVLTRDNRQAQDFTSDRGKLLAAIDKTTHRNFVKNDDHDGDFAGNLASIRTVGDAAHLLINLPERRKAIVYVSYGVRIKLENLVPAQARAGANMKAREETIELHDKLQEIFRQAARANVNVYTFDVCGLRAMGDPPCSMDGWIEEFFLSVANETGGHATLNTNDFNPGIDQMFRENGSYYVLGYQSESKLAADSWRRVEVKVNRPDVEVRSRTRYFAEKPEGARKGSEASALTAPVAGLLPDPGIPLRVNLAAFALPYRRDIDAVAIALLLEHPNAAGVAATEGRVERAEVQVSAFDPEGRPRGTHTVTARVTLHAGDNGVVRYELLTQMELAPGRYSLRMGAHNGATDTTGSVYADVVVPDFAKLPLSMSGVVLSVAPGWPFAPKEALTPLLPIVPTAAREFARSDRITGFLRVYQGQEQTLTPVAVSIRVRDSHDAVLADIPYVLGPERFGVAHGADVRFDLPMARFEPGPHLLTIEAHGAGDEKTSVRRDVRFAVR